MPPSGANKLDFSHRAHLREWMDEPCSYEEFRACLGSLRVSNRLTLNYRPTLRWLRPILLAAKDRSTPLHILDVGSGGGDMLRLIEGRAKTWGVPVQLTGIDLNPHAERAAREFSPAGSTIQWLTGDAFSWQPSVPIDIVLTSLVTHHMADSEIVRFLQWTSATARTGWFVNDLSRAATPYWIYRALSTGLRFHRFVRHDGPVSVRRAFQPADWQQYIAKAGLAHAGIRIEPRWPARLCVSRIGPPFVPTDSSRASPAAVDPQ